MNTNAIAMSFIFSLIAAVINLCSHHVSSFSQQHIIRSQPSILPSSSSFHHNNNPSILYRCRPRHSCSILYSSKSNEELIKTLLNDNTSDDTDPYSRYTHQIAIPLSDASELHSALHAIQTSLVRDCPRLIRACIMPALLRMPLLYVDGSSLESGNVIGSSTTDGSVDSIIEEVVHRAIREVVYGENRDIVEPIMLPFQGLELQGDDNSVLYVVGNNVNIKKKPRKKKQSIFIEDEEENDDDGVIIVDDWSDSTNSGPSGWEILEKLVHEIQHELENKHGLQSCWPKDSAQVEVDFDDDDPLIAAVKQKQKKWRPRVPFVRLPTDFYQELKADSEKKKQTADDEDNDEQELSFVDKGFDGISPLFWYEAWGEDEILTKPGVRMQSVAVYRRMMSGGGESEASFYVPTSSSGPQSWKGGATDSIKSSNISLDLPAGDATLRARERREAAKANERLGEVEQKAEQEWEEGKAKLMKELDGDLDLLAGDDLAQFDVGMETGEVTVEGDAAYTSPWVEETEDSNDKISTATSSDVIDVDVDALIENIARPSAESSDSSTVKDQPQSVKASEQSASKPRRDLPSIEDNPVFQRLWKGKPQITAKGQNTALTLDGTPPSSDESLPPYPSDAHFVGAWRIVSFNDDTDSQESDNFILRVDGQVSGGVSTVLRLSLPL